MEPTIDFFKEIINNRLIVNFPIDHFLSRFIHYLNIIQSTQSSLPHRKISVYIAIEDRLNFVAALFASLSSNSISILGSSLWKKTEVDYVQSNLQPDLFILSDSPPHISNTSNPLPNPLWENCPSHSILISTGGSSGQLKFAWHSWNTLSVAAHGLSKIFPPPHQLHTASNLPLHHVSGLMPIFRAIISQGKYLDLHSLPNEYTIPENIYHLSLIPTQLYSLLQDKKSIEYLKSFKVIFLGGGPCDNYLLQHAWEHDIPAIPSYGMTETAGMIALLPTHYPPLIQYIPSIQNGIILPHVKLTLTKNSEFTPNFHSLKIHSNCLFLGYYPNLPQIMEAFQPMDVIQLSPHNTIVSILKSDHRIISGGEKINPYEIEYYINHYLQTGLAVALGVPDEKWGEKLIAIINIPLSENDIHNLTTYLKQHLAPYKIPKEFIYIKNIPFNTQNKIDKNKLFQLINKL